MNEINNQSPQITQSRWRRTLIVLLGVAALIRLVILIMLASSLSFQTSGYDDYAVNLSEGHGFTRYEDRNADSGLPPLYPYFLFGIYSLFGRSPVSVACVQIGFDLAIMLFLFSIGNRIFDETVGLVSAAFFGLYPYLIYQTLTLNDTEIFILLLIASIWLAYRVHDSNDARYALALGGSLGLAALTKTFIVALLPLVGIWWLQNLGLRRTLRSLSIAGALLLVVVTPWIVRNLLVQREFVLISTNGGSNFHQGNNPCVADYLARGWDAQWVDCLDKSPSDLTEVEDSRWHTQQAITYLREHPEAWPRLFGMKFLALWSPVLMPTGVPPNIPPDEKLALRYHTPVFRLGRALHIIYFGSLLVLAIPGLILALRDKLPVSPLVSVFVLFTVVYVVFHPSTRYRSPADPLLFIISAYTLVRMWRCIKARLPQAV